MFFESIDDHYVQLILLLENIRFWRGETANKDAFAKRLASLADVYVNDAFAVSHRCHASVAAIKKYLPSYAGPLLEKEVRELNKVKRGAKPLVGRWRRFARIAGVWTFFGLISIWNTKGGVDFETRIAFFLGLLGLS